MRSPELAGVLSNKTLRRGLGIAAVASMIYGAAKYGPGILTEVSTRQSEVVAGVPSLVMASDREWVGRAYDYRLYIEQCPQDVIAAQHGNTSSTSFHEDIRTLAEGCYADWVLVDYDTYLDTPPGIVIHFEGKPTQHARKPIWGASGPPPNIQT